MSTKVIIDGYNVVKQVLGQKEITHQQRSRFITQLVGYLKKRNLQGLIVFDGGDTDYPSAHKQGEVTIVFSGYKQSADDIIKQHLHMYREHELVLVTSDHELRTAAYVLGKQTLTAHEFYHQYVEQEDDAHVVRAVDQPLTKLGQSTHELDALMQEATRHMHYKQEDVDYVRHRTTHKKTTKKERVRDRILDKLR